MPVYNWIEGLNPGDIVIFDAAYSGRSSSGDWLKGLVHHCMMKGVKVVGLARRTGFGFGLYLLKNLCDGSRPKAPCSTAWTG